MPPVILAISAETISCDFLIPSFTAAMIISSSNSISSKSITSGLIFKAVTSCFPVIFMVIAPPPEEDSISFFLILPGALQSVPASVSPV